MKILKHIFNVTIWVILGLYMLVIFTFHLSSVQRWMGWKASMTLSEKLGTSVHIGRVNPGFLNRLMLSRVRILDQNGEELFTAKRLGVRIDLFSLLLNGKVSISTAQVFSADANIYQETALSAPNYQFLIDSLSSEGTSNSTLDVRINSLIMRHSSFKYDKRYLPDTPGRLNPDHLFAKDISAHIILKALTKDTLNVNVKKISLAEQSGLKINKLSLQFEGGRSHSQLYHLQMVMPGTDFLLRDAVADYQMDGDSLLLSTLRYQGEIAPSRVTLSDVSCLLPSLSTFNSTLSISSHFTGQGADLNISDLQVGSSTGDVNILCSGWLKELNGHPLWHADISDLSLSAKTVNFISENLQGQHLDVPPVLVRMGDIHITGAADGRGLDEIYTRQQMNTGAGNMAISFNKEATGLFHGNIETRGINLRQMLDNEHFGILAATIDLKGSLAKENPSVKAEGLIQQFEYNDYNYQNVSLNGHYSKKDLSGKLKIDDPNIGLDIEGSMIRDGRQNDIQLHATLLNMSPQAIHLSDKWHDARFYGEIEANISGSGLTDTQGTFDINNLTMLSSTESYELDQLHIETGYDEQLHYVKLSSDFAEAEVKGDFDYETLAQSFTNYLASQMPTMPGLPKVNPSTHNNFHVNATIHKSDWLQRIVQIPVVLTRPVHVEGYVNDDSHNINLQCSLPAFYYNNSGYRNATIDLSTPNDSLKCRAQITKLAANGKHFDINAEARAFNNYLTTTLQWDNHAEERMSGELNALASFQDTFDGKQSAYIAIEPSHLNIHNTIWDVAPCEITYTDKRVGINNFAVRHGNQHLTVDGVASDLTQDSLYVSMNGLDVEYILELANFHAVEFSGRATGRAMACGVFSEKLDASAQIMVDGFKFQQGRIGMLNANVGWDSDKKQIDIHAIADDGQFADGRKSKTYVDGYVSLQNSYINLGIRAQGTRIDFMHSFTHSFISHIGGQAHGNVRIFGPLSTINASGELVVDGEAHVTPLGCTYQLRNDTIRLVPDEIEFVNCHITDTSGNEGIVTGGIHHQHLTNLSYDLYVSANNLLAYDFPDFGENTFYGTVYGSGNVSIHGRDDGTTINLDVTPQRNSFFVYNAANPDAIANQEFIRWGVKNAQQESDEEQERMDEEDLFLLPPPRTPQPTDYEDRGDIRLNFLMNCTPDLNVRLLMDSRTNDYISLYGSGVLRASWFNKGGFQMFGTYRVTQGTYGVTIQDIIKKDFTFQDGGTIVFGGDPYEANLNLQAIHTVNGVSLSDLNVGKSFSNTVRVNCLMNITGQPSQPIIDFDLDIPNVNADEKQMVRSLINGQEEMNQQVIYLLGIGRFYPQGANNSTEADGQQQSQTSLAMQSLLSGTLSSQINSLLKNVIKSNDWSFGANISTGDEGWNNAEYEGIVSGRLLNNRLLVNGQFGYRDKANTTNTSFIGDFDIRYLLFPNGNLAVKVYNQTNDRYFTKSSLNTQGIGLIMKKDFNSFRELFSSKKKEKNTKKTSKTEKK